MIYTLDFQHINTGMKTRVQTAYYVPSITKLKALCKAVRPCHLDQY